MLQETVSKLDAMTLATILFFLGCICGYAMKSTGRG